MKFLISSWLMCLAAAAGQSDKEYLLGKFNPEQDTRFVRIQPAHSAGSAVGGFMRQEAYEAFIRMAAAARNEGITLVIISATRNFESQRRIWENKWNGKVMVEGKVLTTINDPVDRARVILRYSSMPGSSRHHWGTDVDLNSLDNHYFESGEGLTIFQWLQHHGAEFGFCQPYTSKLGGRTGYEEERWHWSYAPLSDRFLEQYRKEVSYTDITGFEGSDTATEIGIIENYVSGVKCDLK